MCILQYYMNMIQVVSSEVLPHLALLLPGYAPWRPWRGMVTG